MMHTSRLARGRAFTLIELLIVCSILGILAAIVIIAFSTQSQHAREIALRNDLRTVRGQIMLYQLQHESRLPDGDRLEELLTTKTDPDGQTGVPLARLGPYLSGFPTNPYNGSRAVKVLGPDQELTPDDQYGWLYQTDGSSFKFAASSTRRDSAGTPVSAY